MVILSPHIVALPAMTSLLAPVALLASVALLIPIAPPLTIFLLAPVAMLTANFYRNESGFKGLLIHSGTAVRSTYKKSFAVPGRLAYSHVPSHGVGVNLAFDKPITIALKSTNYNLWHAFKGGTSIFLASLQRFHYHINLDTVV